MSVDRTAERTLRRKPRRNLSKGSSLEGKGRLRAAFSLRGRGLQRSLSGISMKTSARAYFEVCAGSGKWRKPSSS